MFLANCSWNFFQLSLSSASSSIKSMHFLTKFFRMTLRILFCWSISLEMFNGRSSESTTPLTKLRYSGMSSSYSSWLISSGFLVQIGLVLLSSSSSVYFSLIVFFFVSIFIFSYIFNLWFFTLLFFFLFFFFFIIRNFFVTFLFDQKFDGITDELRVFLDDLLDLLFFNIVSLVFLQVQDNLGTSAKRLTCGVGFDSEGASS